MKRLIFIPLFLTVSVLQAAETGAGGGPQERAIWDKEGNLLPNDQVNSPDVDWTMLKNSDRRNDRYKGVGKMGADGGYACTITLIEPPGGCQLDPNRKAMALTNGHCLGLMKSPDQVGINQPFSQLVQFNNFQDTQSSIVEANIARTIYSSMQGTDVGIVELDKTYAELKGVEPKKIAQAFDGSNLANICSPSAGVDEDKKFLHRSTCESGGAAVLAEGGYFWPEQLRFNCSVVVGSSGSPLFKESTGEIMGLMNTGVSVGESGLYCRMDMPCEINGAEPKKNVTNYGFDVTFLHKCATDKCEIDPAKTDPVKGDCKLPDGAGPRVSTRIAVGGKPKPIELDKRGADAPFSAYQTKWGIAGSADCEKADGYADAPGGTFTPPVESGPDGMYVLCVRGKTADGKWLTSGRAIRVDRKPPAIVLVPSPNGGGYTFKSEDPSDFVGAYTFKVVAKKSDCGKDTGYKEPGPIGARFLKVTETMKGYLCVRGYDGAGNYQSAANATIQAI